MQHEQSRVDNALACDGHVGHKVLCQIPRGEGVEVSTELNTDRLQILAELVIGVVLRAVECHMLEEVSQTLLVVTLLNSTYIVHDIELSQALGLLVVADVIGQSVRQHALANLLVSRQRLRGIHLSKSCGHTHYDGYDQK